MRKVKFRIYIDSRDDQGRNISRWHEGTGIFHQWAQTYEEFETGVGNYTQGLVECTDMPAADASHLAVGKIYKIDPSNIVFLEPFKA